jgi:Holliday junction DNA helicase RuvA
VIAQLKGRVDSVGDGEAVIDVNGVGYLVFAPSRTLANLAVGQAAQLAIETHVREDHIHLYGFSSAQDRESFRTLMTVQGVGAKVGLAILSVLSGEEIARAIAAQDTAPFRRVSGVGPKLAQRIVAELKDKMPAFTAADIAAAAGKGGAVSGGGIVDDAVSALVNLGYGRTEAFTVVSRNVGRLGASTPLGAVIRESLRELGEAARG